MGVAGQYRTDSCVFVFCLYALRFVLSGYFLSLLFLVNCFFFLFCFMLFIYLFGKTEHKKESEVGLEGCWKVLGDDCYDKIY